MVKIIVSMNNVVDIKVSMNNVVDIKVAIRKPPSSLKMNTPQIFNNNSGYRKHLRMAPLV